MSAIVEHDLRRGSWALSLALGIAVIAAAGGVGRLLVGVDWLLQAAVATLVVLGVPALARALRAHPVLPPLLGLVTAVAVLTVAFVPGNALGFVVPTPATVQDAMVLAQQGFVSIAEQGLPAVADPGIAFLLVGGVVVLAWAADVFAFSVHVPALSGAFLLALVAVPVVIDPSGVSWGSLVVTALAYAAVLVTGASARAAARSRRPARGPGLGALLPVLAGSVAVVAVAGTLAGSASGYVRAPTSSGVSGSLFNGSIDPVVALGEDLRRPDPVPVLRYSTDSELPVYLRVISVSDLRGDDWAPSDPDDGGTVPLDDLTEPEGLGSEVPRTDETVTVSIETLRSRWLPVPYPVDDVSGVSGEWQQNAEDGSIRGNGTTRRGDDYEVGTVRLEPTVEQLAAAPAAGGGFDRYLALPGGVPEIVGATALAVTADDTTPYDRARSLQAYFRSSEFRYSEDTPAEEGYDGDGVGVLADFLEEKAGYCVHFASAMTVMARQLGIPSRMAIGYQPGSVVPSSDDDVREYRVLSSDLHAWPELYFEGVGWLPFEPTPGRGAPARYSLPTASTAPGAPGATSTATTAPGTTAAPTASSTPTPTATSTAIGGSAGAADGAGPVLLWTLALAVLLLTPAAVRAVRRDLRRRAAADGSIEAVWEEVVASARDLGVPVVAGTSLRSVEAEIAGALGQAPAAADALARLRVVVERARYAAAGDPGGGVDWSDTAVIRDALRRAAPGRARALAAVLPRSVLPRGAGPASADL